MTEYTVELSADVRVTLNVVADSEDEARRIAYESVGDADYEVDFNIDSIETGDGV